MVAKTSTNLEINNEDSYDDLLVSIEVSTGILSLLITVCDDSSFREEIITKYESELSLDIRPFRLTIPRGEPSLKTALTQLVENNEYLQTGGKAVITVTGTEQLYFLKLGAEKSEQEVFFGYLQWTREALQEFPYPIVLWVTNQMLVNLSKKAPDFWSWRKGVFRFASKKTNAIPGKHIALLNVDLEDQNLSNVDADNSYFLPIEDLQALVAQIEKQRGIEDLSLATLYDRLGQIYKRRLEKGEAQNYLAEQSLAIDYFHKAADLQAKLSKSIDLTFTLNNLASLYRGRGCYQQAESLYLQVIDILLEEGLDGRDCPDSTEIINNLSELYLLQERYQEVEAIFMEVLETKLLRIREKKDSYVDAIDLLALIKKTLEHYQEAEALYTQALEIRKGLLGEEHPDIAFSLNNLASLYYKQERNQEAKLLYMQALEIEKKILGEKHPKIASILNNLGLISQAQGNYQEAESLYLQALKICEQDLKVDNPISVIIRENIDKLHIAIDSKANV